MDSKADKMDLDEMDSDALHISKRVKRSFAGDDLVEPSARKDDVVEEIDISSEDLRVRPWKPTNGHRGNRRSDMRIKGKEVEGKDNHRNNFPVVGTSASNRSMMRQPGRAKARQIQYDEIFALKLQEQFHHETAKLIDMEKYLDVMDSDALHTSKRVKRSFAGDDLAEPSARKDDVVEEIDISSEDLKVRPRKPTNGHPGNRRSDMRIKGKEVEGQDNHRNNFPVAGTSASNRSMMRQPGRAKATQIQSDEIFALKLQEQFHHETAKLIDMEKSMQKLHGHCNRMKMLKLLLLLGRVMILLLSIQGNQ